MNPRVGRKHQQFPSFKAFFSSLKNKCLVCPVYVNTENVFGVFFIIVFLATCHAGKLKGPEVFFEH